MSEQVNLPEVHFKKLTRGEFDSLVKDDTYFYFVLEEDGRYSLYVGSTITSNAITIVETFPTVGEMGRFYFQPSTGV